MKRCQKSAISFAIGLLLWGEGRIGGGWLCSVIRRFWMVIVVFAINIFCLRQPALRQSLATARRTKLYNARNVPLQLILHEYLHQTKPLATDNGTQKVDCWRHRVSLGKQRPTQWRQSSQLSSNGLWLQNFVRRFGGVGLAKMFAYAASRVVSAILYRTHKCVWE